MVRRTRRRYYRRKSGRWSSNIKGFKLEGAAEPGEIFGDSYTIAQNPDQSNTNVSQMFTVKNVEVSAQIEANSSQTPQDIEDITYYIMYVPQGYPIDVTLPSKHPEWIMAYKYIGQAMTSTSTTPPLPQKIKTRLSRKLNSGDSIIFLFNGYNQNGQNTIGIKMRALVRWWTKAN